MSDGLRRDGYVPLEDYAVLGDGRTVVLVASDGQIDWWPIPTLDAPAMCAAILDPQTGGSFRLAPLEEHRCERRYVEGTNVLETTFTTASGSVRVTEALTSGSAGTLPWTELARRVDGLSGTVEMAWEFRPGNRFGRNRSWLTLHDGTPIVHLDDQSVGLILHGADPASSTTETTPHDVRGRFAVAAGRRTTLTAVATDHEPLLLPPGQDVELRIDRTVASWQRWTELIRYSGDWPEPVKRSALLLKTLLSGTSGAIAAAATTSLPERIGGDKNWDYRYSWTRDSSFTIGAFMRLGLHEEVHAAVSWLLGVMRRTGPELQVFYTLDGRVASREDDLQAPGYRGSRPVRAGNAASGQLQLGTYGDLFDTLARYAEAGHVLDPSTGRMLAEYADSCCDRWLNRDSGIWELDVTEHYTISKMGCWVALDRACRLAEAGQIPEHRAHRWRDEARDIQEWVNTNCWSDEKQAYTFYAGTDELDAAVLLAGRTGFERGDRLSTTIDAITRELVPGDGSLVHRYSGMQTEEGAFVACTFWLVDALAHCGRGDEARALMDRAVSLANDVGVLSEEIDPATGGFLGNLPQGLSHLALINAAHTLSALQDRR